MASGVAAASAAAVSASAAAACAAAPVAAQSLWAALLPLHALLAQQPQPMLPWPVQPPLAALLPWVAPTSEYEMIVTVEFGLAE